MARQTLHSVCCVVECEALIAEVERGIGAPMGDPIEIARIVTQLESDTISAPRNLSAALLGRLDEVAARHHGLVPLHGRLFTQWMHHAFPNECAHPLPSQWNETAASTFKYQAQRSPEEWLQDFDQGNVSGPLPGSSGERPPEELMPWSDEEELFEESHDHYGFALGIKHVTLLLAFLSVIVDRMRSGLSALRREEEGLPGLQKRRR
jgi:hypothetical protein